MKFLSQMRIVLVALVMLLMIYLTSFLTGCTREIVREVSVPARVPSLCTMACPAPEGTPATNGELAEAWAARGETIQCYRSRQQCVIEMTHKPSPP